MIPLDERTGFTRTGDLLMMGRVSKYYTCWPATVDPRYRCP